MKVLLAGRNGQVGSELQSQLQELGSVIATDRTGDGEFRERRAAAGLLDVGEDAVLDQLFPEIDHHNDYSINVFGNIREPRFTSMSNVFHPSTIDISFAHEGTGICAGIKDEDGNWNVIGHKNRIIEVDEFKVGNLVKHDESNYRQTCVDN